MEVSMSSKFESQNGYRLRRKVRAIVRNDQGEYLLIQPLGYADDSWSFVGGGVEDGENSEVAMQREMAEEVGITHFMRLEKSSQRRSYIFSDRIKKKRNVDYDGQISDIFFVVVSASTKVVILRTEIKDFRWVSRIEIEKLVKVPEQLQIFKEVEAELSNHRRAS